ncbi:hypothetical protein IT570_01985 [Candidatus Sumerlaeota bacterium]|nr:hypothetical protein [Candidatus Sumerlaeota bacterium]
MKRSIQIQIGLVVVSIFVLIGVLFYNPAPVEKPTKIVVDFGDGGKRVVGGNAEPTESDENSIPSPEETDPATLMPVDEASPAEPAEPTDAAASVPAPPAASAEPAQPALSRTKANLPKGTPPPPTPTRVPRKTPVHLPGGGTLDLSKMATEYK